MDVFEQFAITLMLSTLAMAITFAVLRNLQGRPSVNKARAMYVSPFAEDKIFHALFAIYVLVFGTLSILQHQTLHNYGFDLGIFSQVVWNSLNGRLFESSIRIDAPSFLGQHFSPLLLALVPLYAIWSDPRMLLITQTIGLAGTAFPLYWFARSQIGRTLALVIAVAYFLFPPVQYVNLFEFHEIALATPLLTFAIFFLLRGRDLPFLVCLLLALMTKEEVAFIAAAIGVYVMMVRRRFWLGLGLGLSGLGLAVLLLFYVIPFFLGRSYDTNFFVMGRYAYLGKDVHEIVFTAITQPGVVLQHLLVPAKLEFVLQLLIPLGFAPLFGGEVLAMALPSLAYLLIGDYPYQYSIHYQYTAPLLPFIFFATVIGLKRISKWHLPMLGFWEKSPVFRTATLTILISLASGVSYFFQAPGPLASQFDPNQYRITAHTLLGEQLIQTIPTGASLMTEMTLVPHLTQRQYVYYAQFVSDLRRIDYLFADQTLPIHGAYQMIWDDVLTLPYFETAAEKDGYVLKKRAVSTFAYPSNIQFDQHITLLGYTIESQEPLRPGSPLSLVLTWRADKAIHDRYVVFVHLVDSHGYIWAQGDREPGNGWFRTDRWNAGDVTPDLYALDLPADLPLGVYQISVGLYAVESQMRLKASDQVGNQLGSEPVVLTIHVSE